MLLLAALGFVCGISVLLLTPFSWPLAYLGIVLAVVCFILYGLRKHRLHVYAGIFSLFLALGVMRTLFFVPALPPAFAPLVDTEATVVGTVVTPPDIRETTQRVTIEIEAEGETTRVLAVAPLFPEISYGSRVEAHGTLALPEPFATDGAREFRYDQFLAKDGIHLIMQKAHIEEVASRTGVWFGVLGFFADIKQNGIEALSHALPEPHASLASGLILGGKQGLGESLLDDFIAAGLVHIVVLSGYNVMIVADFVMRVFGFLSKQMGAFVGSAAILLFVLSAGAGPASIRAGLMAAIALYARATGRTYDAFRALLLAGVCMLLFNPLTLLYDPGFQLSFVATLGLIFGAPLVEARLASVRSGFFREILSSTIAAQIAVLPLLLYQNGLFSLVALPANILVLPVVPFAMLTSFTALLAGLLVPALAPLISLPAYAFLSYIIGMVEFAAGLPFAAFTVPAFPFVVSVGAYALLALVVMHLSKSRAKVPSGTKVVS